MNKKNFIFYDPWHSSISANTLTTFHLSTSQRHLNQPSPPSPASASYSGIFHRHSSPSYIGLGVFFGNFTSRRRAVEYTNFKINVDV
ncbi:hypothetical protein Q3G72_013033 [Acer saccharum]|nr:hypothetical protein Q3G72_013033 [Acer saccharum]